MHFRFFRTIFFILTALQTVLSFDSFASQTLTKPLSVVFTGGSSLGAYQAGFFFQINQKIKNQSLPYKIKSLSGSSAGAINALLALKDTCSTSSIEPEDSLELKVWSKFTLKNLYIPNEKDPASVLSRRKIKAILKEVAVLWKKGFSRNCDISLTFTATRLNSEIRKFNGLLLNRAEETFTVRIKGQGLGRPPEITNSISPYTKGSINILGFKKNDFNHNFYILSDLVTASAAFPYFFKPEVIEYCELNLSNIYTSSHHNSMSLYCDQTIENQKDLFFDGGLLNSSPLISILDKSTENTEEDFDEKIEHLIISSESRTSSSFFNDDGKKKGFLEKFLFNYRSTVNDASLFERLKNQSDVNISKSSNYIPRISEPFLSFMGFMDSKFLEFDFILGMVEADFFIENKTGSRISNLKPSTPGLLLQKKKCLKDLFLRNKHRCRELQDQDFLKLAELSLDTLKIECQKSLAILGTNRLNPLCIRFSPKELKEVNEKKNDETRLKYSLRHLAGNNFNFYDFKNTSPYKIPLEIRHQISNKINEIKKNRDSPYSQDIKLVEKALLFSEFYPRKSFFSIMVGDTLELSYRQSLDRLNFLKSNFLKFSASLQIDRLEKIITNSSNKHYSLSISPLIGYDYTFASNSLIESSFGLRAGPKFYPESEINDVIPSAQILTSVSFVEKYRLQIAWEFDLENNTNEVLIGVGLEFY